MTEETSRNERRSTRKHRDILEAAARLADRKGYAAVSIEGIASEAGVGKQTIYRWWPSKAALYVEVYSELVPRSGLATGSARGVAGLAVLLTQLFRLYRETPAGRILCGLLGAANVDESARLAIQQGLVLSRADIIERTVRDQLAEPAERAVVNEIVVAVVWKRLISDPESLDSRFAEKLAQIAMRAAKGGAT